MRFRNVRIAAFGHALAPDRVTSLALEERLAPLYARFRLHPGRIEMMSGIRERRFWPPGTPPSQEAARAAEAALAASGVDRDRIGCLVHASVCRDYLEPATATIVHESLRLPPSCMPFDVSNACLGVANGMVLVANMIDQGQIEAGLVVAGEDGRPLIESTIAALLADEQLTKAALKEAFASLTIGSGAAAVVLERMGAGRTDQRLVGGAVLAATQHNVLCRGGIDGRHAGPLMRTDSEALLRAGDELAARTFAEFLREIDWRREDIDRTVTHQVGTAHKRVIFETIGLAETIDYPTLETFGNMASVSLPLSFSMAVEAGFIRHGERVMMLGIGSGLNCLMLGVEW
ncbi:MAG: 3-oxoacyl-ACP synthase III [Planctomycetota bacterium]